jgi:hypothetical protein
MYRNCMRHWTIWMLHALCLFPLSLSSWNSVNSRTRVRRFLRPLKDAWTSFFGVSRKEAEEWHGLPRYNQNISQDSLNDNKFTEYAMVRNILQCNELGLRYYADVAGKCFLSVRSTCRASFVDTETHAVVY